MPATRSATLHLRLAVDERQALDELAETSGLTASAIARAGLRAVLADPSLVVGRAGAAPEDAGPPAPTSEKRTRARRRKR